MRLKEINDNEIKIEEKTVRDKETNRTLLN